MMNKIDPEYSGKLKKFGAIDINACYNCGNCTAICPLSDENNSFPRKMLRASVLGLDDKIKSSLDPWLCYYCGECTETCPREAFPGELMMTLRRYLTTKYDWTGLSGILYQHVWANILYFLLIIVAVIGYAFYKDFDTAAIMHTGHLFEIIAIAGVFAVILLPNIIRMWWLSILKPKKSVPIKTYATKLWELIVHMFTQKRTLDCENKTIRWFEHFILVLGYLALLFTTVVLDWFNTENTFIIILGYVESAIIFIVTFIFILERYQKKIEQTAHSHPSDWLFVIWLFLMGLTAFIVRLFVDLNIIDRQLWMYLIHVIVLGQWALIIVPFGKWTHFLYRSFAMYFAELQKA